MFKAYLKVNLQNFFLAVNIENAIIFKISKFIDRLINNQNLFNSKENNRRMNCR